MKNFGKTIGITFLNLAFGLIIFSNFSISVTKALDAETVCNWMNNQGSTNESVGAEKPGESAEKKSGNNLEGKIAVITEERLTPADNKFTFNCYRKTECVFELKEVEADGPVSSDKRLRKCTPTYSSTCTATITDPQEIRLKAQTGENYTICEPVQVLLSDSGTDMLYHYIGLIYTYAAGLGALLSVLFIIVAGIQIATAGDAADAVSKAKGMIEKNLIGLALLFLSALILYTINPNFFVL